MNAAARVIHEHNIFTGQGLTVRLSLTQRYFFMLMTLLLLTAIGIIDMTHENRHALSDLEQLTRQTHALRLEYGQLLLEQAALSAPTRVKQVAANKFSMVIPSGRQTIVLRDTHRSALAHNAVSRVRHAF